MSSLKIPAPLRAKVHARAHGCCEYCGIPEAAAFFNHEPDHVIARQHRGETVLENLALACIQCNRCKGTNIASVDPVTQAIVPLFNPRKDRWLDHFRHERGRIVPLTASGRATSALLEFNSAEREQIRENLWHAGRYPLTT